MASSIGQGAYEKTPKNAFIKFPRDPLSGSTSGIGSGSSSESFGRYSAEPTHHFKYRPGSRQWWKTYKASYMSAKGTWGMSIQQKFNPVKQIGGSSGYLDQQPKIKRSADFRTMVNYGKDATNHFLPRGGNVLRVVGRDDSENPASFTGGYNGSGFQENYGGETGNVGASRNPIRGSDMERRNVQQLQTGDQIKSTNDNVITGNAGGDNTNYQPQLDIIEDYNPNHMGTNTEADDYRPELDIIEDYKNQTQSLDADLHEARQQLAAMSILAENYKNQSDKTKSELAHAVKIIEDNLNHYNRVIDQLRNEDEIQNLHQQLDILREQLYLITSITKGDASTQTVERLRRLSITMKADQGTSPYNTPVEDRGTNPKTPPTPPTPPMHADQGTSPKTPSIIDLISSSSSGSASPELGPEDKIAKHIEDLIERVFDNANENNVVFPPQILNLMQNVQNDLTTLLFQAHGDFELGLGVDPTLMSGLNTINVLLEEAASPYTLKYGSLRAIVNLFEQSLYKIRQLQSHVSRRIRRGSGSSGGAMST